MPATPLLDGLAFRRRERRRPGGCGRGGDRALLDHQLADGAPAEMGVDPFQHDRAELLHLERE